MKNQRWIMSIVRWLPVIVRTGIAEHVISTRLDARGFQAVVLVMSPRSSKVIIIVPSLSGHHPFCLSEHLSLEQWLLDIEWIRSTSGSVKII